MSELTTKQPAGTPTWIDLGIPDLDRAMTFYGALFGWEFDVGPAEFGHYTQCLLRGRPVAAIRPNPDPDATDFWWNVYFATDDCDAAAARARDAGGSIITGPMDVLDQGRTAIIKDTTGAQCGLWQAGAHIGCEIVNEPNALLRNDLVTAESGPARDFYVAVFGYTLDANPDMPELDFTFLRRPMATRSAASPVTQRPRSPVGGPCSRWTTPMRRRGERSTRVGPRPSPTT